MLFIAVFFQGQADEHKDILPLFQQNTLSTQVAFRERSGQVIQSFQAILTQLDTRFFYPVANRIRGALTQNMGPERKSRYPHPQYWKTVKPETLNHLSPGTHLSVDRKARFQEANLRHASIHVPN